MNIFITILIFIVILLIYLHFMSEFKFVNKFSIYDVEYTNRSELQKICELKQPFVFELQLQSQDNINKSQNMCVFDNSDNEFVSLSYSSLEELLEKDQGGNYYSMKNQDFAKNEFPLTFSELNKYINPYFSWNTTYDVIMGSNNAHTSLLYLRESGMFIYVKSGNVNVKLMAYNKDHESSNICLWNEDEPMNCEIGDVFLTGSQVLFVPSWCMYTLQFDKNAVVYTITHQTPPNAIVNMPYYCMEFLQSQNTEEKVLKTIEIPKIAEEEEIEITNTDE